MSRQNTKIGPLLISLGCIVGVGAVGAGIAIFFLFWVVPQIRAVIS